MYYDEYGYHDDNSYDFYPHWFPDETKYTWQKYIRELIPVSRYTPDMPELNLSNFHNVFVYGTLKKSCHNNKLIKSAVFLGKAWTKVKCLKMYVNEYNVPVVFFTSQSDGLAVQGELYSVTPAQLRNLDRLEANGDYYKRRRVVVEYDNGEMTKAFMYFGLKSEFSMKGLTPSDTFTRKKTAQEYYTYIPNQYK